jgi:uncharacterized protein YndB with AHSA1/START domain
MNDNLTATASTTIHAPASEVWDALVDPEKIKQYMFGTNVVSDFKEGSPIVWKGEWKGKSYEDKGTIKRVTPGRLLEYTHNEHTVIVELSGNDGTTRVDLRQDHNPNEKAKQESEKNWAMMLEGLKKLVEE